MKCYICGSKDVKELFSKIHTHYYKCKVCNVLFQHPQHGKKIKELYERGYYSNDERKIDQFVNYFSKEKNQNIIKKIKQHSPNGQLLDIGAGYGYFVKNAKDAGFEAYGIEPSIDSVKAAKRLLNVKLDCGFFDNKYRKGELFDVITAFHVIEHVVNPQLFITDIRNKLSDGGLLVIETPNIKSFNATFMKEDWPFVIPDEHLFLFSHKSLKYMLEKNRFKLVYSQRIGPFIHAKRDKKITNEIRSQKPSWKMKNIKAVYDFLSKNLMLGDHILMIFEKV